jgi:hypothetical protein
MEAWIWKGKMNDEALGETPTLADERALHARLCENLYVIFEENQERSLANKQRYKRKGVKRYI